MSILGLPARLPPAQVRGGGRHTGVLAAVPGVLGQAGQLRMSTSSATSPTRFCTGRTSAVAYEGDYVPADFAKATTSCLCQNGTRVVAVGNYSNPEIKSVERECMQRV